MTVELSGTCKLSFIKGLRRLSNRWLFEKFELSKIVRIDLDLVRVKLKRKTHQNSEI